MRRIKSRLLGVKGSSIDHACGPILVYSYPGRLAAVTWNIAKIRLNKQALTDVWTLTLSPCALYCPTEYFQSYIIVTFAAHSALIIFSLCRILGICAITEHVLTRPIGRLPSWADGRDFCHEVLGALGFHIVIPVSLLYDSGFPNCADGGRYFQIFRIHGLFVCILPVLVRCPLG